MNRPNFQDLAAKTKPILKKPEELTQYDLEPDYTPGEYSFSFMPQKDISGYEVLLCLPIILNLQHPAIGGQLIALLNEHKSLRRHWPIQGEVIQANGVHPR